MNSGNADTSIPAFSIRKLIAPIVILGIAAGIVMALLNPQPELKTTVKEPVPIAVRAVTVMPDTKTLTVMSEGNVYPRQEAKIIAQLSSEVAALSPSMIAGGEFSKGDVLISIDARDYEIALSRAKANVERSRAEYRFADSELMRVQSLYAKELASASQLQQAERAQQVSDAMLKEAEAALERAEIDLERTQIVAPFDGRVRTESLDEGQFLQKGGAVATIYATDALEVRLPLPDAQLAYLDPTFAQTGRAPIDRDVAVTLAADFAGAKQTWQGRLIRTEGDISQRSRFVNVIAEVTDTTSTEGTRLPLGLFVTATIEGRTLDELISLPRTALRDDETVMVIDDDNKLHFRTIEVFRLGDEEVIVSAGLQAGERVCVSPLQFVVEGMAVTVIN
jgi:RND family efflux transporter MFP subunit